MGIAIRCHYIRECVVFLYVLFLVHMQFPFKHVWICLNSSVAFISHFVDFNYFLFHLASQFDNKIQPEADLVSCVLAMFWFPFFKKSFSIQMHFKSHTRNPARENP